MIVFGSCPVIIKTKTIKTKIYLIKEIKT